MNISFTSRFIIAKPAFLSVFPVLRFYIWHFSQYHAIEGRIKIFWRGSAGLAYVVKKTVVLVGMMGAGKTAVGQALARALAVPFLDSDEEIRRAANMEIAEVFERDGEAFFRDREAEVIARLLESEHCVLSTGGGAFLAARNRDQISRAGVSVWLNAPLALLWERVRHKNTRPLLHTRDPKATLAQIYQARVPVYALADLEVEARSDFSIARMTQEVLGALKTRPDVVEET